MPSRWIRKGPNKLKKCSQRRTDSCGPETDGCCSVVACTYCIEFATYSGSQYGTAEDAGTGWIGTIAGAEFYAYWQKNVDGECEFVVELNGYEVYRKSCYEGQSCRDSSDSTTATIDYDEGTLTWTKQEFRPLPLVDDPETGCRTWFCGECHCSCEALCVTITEPDGTVIRGELPDVSYSDCEGPTWAAVIGYYDLSVTLDRDEVDGSCIASLSSSGEDGGWVEVTGCKDLSASWTLYDGTTIAVVCKGCEECSTTDAGICICGRSLGTAPTLSFASANAPGTIHTITLSYSSNIDDGLVCTPVMPCSGYIGRFDGTLALPMGGSRTEGIDFRLVCSLDCSGYCLYWRYDSRFIDGWCRNSSPGSVDCTCPATIVYPANNTSVVFDCTVDPWSYQIPEWVIEEDPTNCP